MWLMRVLRSARPRFSLSHTHSSFSLSSLSLLFSFASLLAELRHGLAAGEVSEKKRSAGENEPAHCTGSYARMLLLHMQQLSADFIDRFNPIFFVGED